MDDHVPIDDDDSTAAPAPAQSKDTSVVQYAVQWGRPLRRRVYVRIPLEQGVCNIRYERAFGVWVSIAWIFVCDRRNTQQACT